MNHFIMFDCSKLRVFSFLDTSLSILTKCQEHIENTVKNGPATLFGGDKDGREWTECCVWTSDSYTDDLILFSVSVLHPHWPFFLIPFLDLSTCQKPGRCDLLPRVIKSNSFHSCIRTLSLPVFLHACPRSMFNKVHVVAKKHEVWYIMYKYMRLFRSDFISSDLFVCMLFQR